MGKDRPILSAGLLYINMFYEITYCWGHYQWDQNEYCHELDKKRKDIVIVIKLKKRVPITAATTRSYLPIQHTLKERVTPKVRYRDLQDGYQVPMKP